MPIDGLTDRPKKKVPTIGKLRKGDKKTDPKKPGKDRPFFRFASEDDALQSHFYEVFEREPDTIEVYLPYATLEENFPTWREEWVAGGLVHRCTGKEMVLWKDQDGIYQETPRPCPYKDLPKGDPGRKCKESGVLHVIIPALGEWGQVEVPTGAIWDCKELTDNIAAIDDLAHQASIMKGQQVTMQVIPCILKRVPRMTSTPGENGKRFRREKWPLHLMVKSSFMAELAELQQQRMFSAIETRQLAAPADLEVDYPVHNGDDVERPETEIVDDPEPEPEPNGDVPTAARKAPNLLKYVNERVQVPYDSVSALRAELSNAGLEGDKWPAYNRDPEWWQRAFDLAFEVAESKEYAEAA